MSEREPQVAPTPTSRTVPDDLGENWPIGSAIRDLLDWLLAAGSAGVLAGGCWQALAERRSRAADQQERLDAAIDALSASVTAHGQTVREQLVELSHIRQRQATMLSHIAGRS